MTIRRLVAALSVALVAGCGGSDGPAPSDEPLTVEQALAADVDDSVRVRGTLIATDEGVWLCTALRDSSPRRCGKPSLRVRGLDLVGVSNMEQGKSLGRSFPEVVLVGEIADGVLTVVQ